MDEFNFKSIADKGFSLGFQRGVLELQLELFKAMEVENSSTISYKSIMKISNLLIKSQNNEI